MKKVKNKISGIADIISLSALAKQYFNKDKSWLYHKLNEDTVNGKLYKFTDSEIGTLIESLSSISDRIALSIEGLKEIRQISKKENGVFFTETNPFTHSLFKEWMHLLPTTTFLEPFAGSNNIPLLISEAGYSTRWKCYDICPALENNMPHHKIIKRDCISNFPKGYKVSVTNPPYLERSSASRQNLLYPNSRYNNLYKVCLDKMLSSCEYIAAIIPESFLTSPLFYTRIYGIVSLNMKISSTTSYPVCLALFVPEKQNKDFPIYMGSNRIGTYYELERYRTKLGDTAIKNEWVFNNPDGNIGVCCIDNSTTASIHFCNGESIASSKIKISSRHYTRISGLPTHLDLESFVAKCNQILNQFRHDTKDVFLTPFRGLRKDGMYRRRLDFNTIKKIMDEALST